MFDSLPPRLLHALMLSLAIHAVLLLGVVSALPERAETPAVTITAVLGSAANRVAAPAVMAYAPKPAVAAQRSPAPAMPRLNARSPVVAESSIVASPPPPVSGLPAEPVNAPPLVADSRAGSTGAQTHAPELPHDAVNADGLREYRVSLAIAARRFKRYPALARERGWEGTTEVALLVSSRLPVPEVILLRSSGHPVLDRQAQEMMAQAALATMLPESLRGRDLRIVLPVKFSLESDQ